jgi:hypothetical protein
MSEVDARSNAEVIEALPDCERLPQVDRKCPLAAEGKPCQYHARQVIDGVMMALRVKYGFDDSAAIVRNSPMSIGAYIELGDLWFAGKRDIAKMYAKTANPAPRSLAHTKGE